MSFVKEMISFLAARKKFWLVPSIGVLVLMGALLLVSSGSVLAPFIYAIF